MYSLEEGLLNLQFYLCTRRITSLLSPPPFFFLFLGVHTRMKCHSYKLTWRLKHKEIDITQWRSEERESKQDVEMVSGVLSLYYSFVTVLFGELQHNKCSFPLTFPSSHHQKKANKNPN